MLKPEANNSNYAGSGAATSSYVADLVGIDHVELGSDMFGAESEVRYTADGADREAGLRAARPTGFTISMRVGWNGKDAGALRDKMAAYEAVGVQHIMVALHGSRGR